MTNAVVKPATTIEIWDIDPIHSTVQFAVRHMMISNVRGEFKIASGTIRLDRDNPDNASIVATIDATSVNTREVDRDKHLRSSDFLDSAHYSEIIFASKRVAVTEQGRCKISGDLSIHGLTKEVTLVAEPLSPTIRDPWGNFRRGTSATTQINRRDFGLEWNEVLEAGGVLVGDQVSITIDVQLVKSKEKPLVVPDDVSI